MKKMLCAAAALCALLGGWVAPVSAQTPEAGQATGYTALALWTQPIEGSRRYDVYWAFAATGVEGDEQVTYGGLGHYTCSTDNWGIVQLFCFRGRVRPLGSDEFSIDPALREARLTIENKGVTNEVVWTASEDPYVYHGVFNMGGYTNAYADINRRATTEAQILGETLPGGNTRILAMLSLESGAVFYDGSDPRSGF